MKNSDIINIKEGTTECFVFKNKLSLKGPGLKDSKPFYNPSMELNRDLSIIFIQWLIEQRKKHLSLLDGLAASGIKGVRIANEVDGDFDVTINDWDEQAHSLIKKNIKNKESINAFATQKNLNVLLSENRYDYIDIDPFGSPVYFIDSAVRSVLNNGVIACTATDTATLCGVYPQVCFRRYGAKTFHCYLMHEIGLRILLGLICREAAKYDKGIKPIINYSTDYYFRLFVMIKNGKRHANESIKKYSLIDLKEYFSDNEDRQIGPLWLGEIQDKKAVKEVRTLLFKKELNTKNSIWKLLSLLEEEANAPIYFYTTENLATRLKTSPIKLGKIINMLETNGYKATKTHFSSIGFKTDASHDEILNIIKKT